MNTRGIFITGTDTDVGKTWFTARLCRALRANDIDAGVWKPVQSGFLLGETNADSHILKTISGVADEEPEICNLSLKAPLAPVLSARLEGCEIDFDELISQADLLLSKHHVLLAEGAGGLAAPLRGDGLVVHLAAKLGFPLLIVSRPGLGTVNHTVLTVDFAQRHGLEVLGVVLNGYDQTPERVKAWEEVPPGSKLEDSLSTNPLLIEHYCGVPVLGLIPRIGADGGEQMFENHVQLERIIQQISTK